MTPNEVLDALRKLNESSEHIYALVPGTIFSGGIGQDVWDVVYLNGGEGLASRDESALKAIEQAKSGVN